jgi:hypothetical protein
MERMIAGRIAGCFALLAVVCVVAVFFFPAVQGPYSAVHGPVTVFHGARAAAGLRSDVVRAALCCPGNTVASAAVAYWIPELNAESVSHFLAGGRRNLLRC